MEKEANSSSIKVYVRVRPILPIEKNTDSIV
jgi:hypothetical protein